ncbi:stress response protein NhaX [Peptococcaceae bacterium CEB3]|nr:stress response protein NhaX [Peptococcaceae bacterium CEB3]
MTGSLETKVLLYSDGSDQSFSAAVYTATLLKNMPSMSLTVVQTEEAAQHAPDLEYSWLNTWPTTPSRDLRERVIDESDAATKKVYDEIRTKTVRIFTERGLKVTHEVIPAGVNISDTVEAILEFAKRNKCELIVMGTRGLTSLKGLLFGSLAHEMLTKSTIPVLLIKKLPQEFIDDL